jgi:hypothetical protein
MSERSVFDHRPDPELGRVLRALLSSNDDDIFAARILASAHRSQGEIQWWEVLTAWARPGLIAAGILAAAATVWSLRALPEGNSGVQLGDPLSAAGERAAVPAYLVSPETWDIDAVMAAFTENE